MLEATVVNRKRVVMRNVCSGMKHQEENGIHHEKLSKEVRDWYFEKKKNGNLSLGLDPCEIPTKSERVLTLCDEFSRFT